MSEIFASNSDCAGTTIGTLFVLYDAEYSNWLLPVRADYRDFYAALTGKNLRLCPECGIGTMIRMELAPVGLRLDSS